MSGTFAPKGNLRGFIMPDFIASDSSLAAGARILYSVVCSSAGEKDHCWPSHATLAKKAGCSVSSVKVHLDQLVRRGLIKIQSKPGAVRSCIYYLLRPSSSVLPGHSQNLTSQNLATTQPESGYYLNLNEFKELTPISPQTPRPEKAVRNRMSRNGGGYFFENKKFEKFWQCYPKKEAKEAARMFWHKLAKAQKLPDLPALLNTLRQFQENFSWQRENGRYVPQLVNWLKAKRWLDETAKPSPELLTQPQIRYEDDTPLSLEQIRAAYQKRNAAQTDAAPVQHLASKEGLLPFSVAGFFNTQPRQKENNYGVGTRKGTGSVSCL